MANPYNITEVDIPGVYGAVQSARMARIQAMLGERQIAAADRQAERDNARNIALTRLFGGSSGTSGASGGQNPVVAAYGGQPPPSAQPAITPPGLPGANPAGTPQPARINPEAARALIAADPEHGPALIRAITQMNDEQLTSAQARLRALAPLYANAARIPYGTDGSERRAYIRSVLPEIEQMGIDPQQALGWDPTDQNLNSHMSFGQTVQEALANARPRLRNIGPGDTVIDENNPHGRPVAESPYFPGPNGELFRRSDVEPPTYTDEDIRRMESEGGAGQPNAPGTFP